jgi:hypothetical protein
MESIPLGADLRRSPLQNAANRRYHVVLDRRNPPRQRLRRFSIASHQDPSCSPSGAISDRTRSEAARGRTCRRDSRAPLLRKAIRTHTVALSEHAEERRTRLEDLVLVCVRTCRTMPELDSSGTRYYRPLVIRCFPKQAAYPDIAMAQPGPLSDLWIGPAFRNLGRGVF